MAWWTIEDVALMQMLLDVKNGADPGVVYTEYYANSDHFYKENEE